MCFIDKLLPPRDTEGSLIVAEGEEETDETKVDDDLEEIDSPARASRKVPTRASQTQIGKNKKPNIDDVLASYICTAQETLKAKANKSNTNTEDEDVSFFQFSFTIGQKIERRRKIEIQNEYNVYFTINYIFKIWASSVLTFSYSSVLIPSPSISTSYLCLFFYPPLVF